MANPEHLAILEQGVDAWNEWRKDEELIRPWLNWADLGYEDLRGADLRGTFLFDAALSGAVLRGADLSDTDLSETELSMAYFNGTVLSRAVLSGAILNRTVFSNANLRGADLSAAVLFDTTFANVDLSEVNGLEAVIHEGPSSIGIDTIYHSNGKIPAAFLRGPGVSENFISHMASPTGQLFDFYFCIISYSTNDEVFARRLHADLQMSGVRCWFARGDTKITSSLIDSVHVKLLIILSGDSIQSRRVEHEVLSAITKEFKQHDKRRVLFPIRTDDAVMDTDVPWAQMMRDTRHIGDFTEWKDHDAYQRAFDRLLQDLRQSEGGN